MNSCSGISPDLLRIDAAAEAERIQGWIRQIVLQQFKRKGAVGMSPAAASRTI
jgi:hypothetical protein